MSKINLIYFDFIGTFGGAQQSTSTLLNHLNQNYNDQVKPIVYFVNGTNENFLKSLANMEVRKIYTPNIKNFSIFNIRGRFFYAFLYMLFCVLYLILKSPKKSIFLCNSVKSLTILCFVKIFRNIEINYYCRGWGDPKSFNFFSKCMMRYFVKKVYCVSTSTKKNLISFVPEKKLYVTYTSVNLDYVKKYKKKENSINLSELKVLFAGAIIKTKGLHTLLEALSLMSIAERNKVKIFIAGKINLEDDYYKNCNELVIKNNIDAVWLNWVDNIPELMSGMDLICLPSHTEGMPRVIQEGMSLEKICVSTPVGGIPDLIIDGKTGYLFGVNDSKALKNILSDVLSKNYDQSIGERASKRVFDEFNLESQVKLFLKFLKES